MIIRALIFALMILWACAAEATFTYNGTQQGSYGSNLVINPSFETTPSEYSCNNIFGGWCYSSGSYSTARVTTPTAQDGTYSAYLKSQYDSYEGMYGYDRVRQNITLTAYKEYKVEAYVRDTATSAGLTVKMTNTAETSNLCTVTDTASNQDVWTYVTCTVPDTNTVTTGRILIYGSDTPTGQPISYYIDNIKVREYTPPGTNVKLNLPAGTNAGRKVYLYNTSGNIAYTAIVDDGTDTATIASVTTGTYFWYITDTDGTTFLDNSDWVTVANGDDFTWTNSGLSKDATWGFVIAGDSNSNGNCLDNGDTGCYMKLQRNGSDYLLMGSAFGNNLATGKTASASSETNPASYAIDGDPNTNWYTTSTSGQWLCIDFGAPTTFNRIIYYQRTITPSNETANGGNSMSVQVSTADTGCSAGDMTTVANATESRKQLQFVTSIGFGAQTKRYVRLYFTSVYTRPEAYDIQVYNEGASNPASDIEYLLIRKDSDLSSNFVNGLKYDSYVAEGDGSVTFTRNVTGWFNLSVNYKQMSGVAWRKRITYSTSVDSASEFKFVVHKYNPSGCVQTKANLTYWTSSTDDHGACADLNWDNYGTMGIEYAVNFHSMGMSLPYSFGITPDAGCYAQWYDSPENYYQKDHEHVIGQDVDDNWIQTYTVLSRKQTGSAGSGTSAGMKPNFVTKAGQTYSFDVIVFRSVDPAPYQVQKQMYVSYADGKGQNLSDDIKPLWSVAHQTNFITNNNDHCLQVLNVHDSGRGATAGVLPWTWSLIGLSDPDLFKKSFLAYRKSAGLNYGYGNGSTVTPEDPFNVTPTLTGNSRNPFVSAVLLGYAVQKGWVSVQASCSDYSTCVTTAERDALLTTVQGYFPTSGTIKTYGGHLDHLGIVWWTPGDWENSYDSYTNTLITYYLALKGLQQAGASVDAARLSNAKTELQNMYDATDGYIHFSKFGHWRAVSSQAASGGQYYDGAGDMIGPTTARFVAPAGGSASVRVRKSNYSGKMVVTNNGNAVSGSPFDLYDTSGVWSIYSTAYEDIWNETGLENLLGVQTRTYGTAPPVASEMYGKNYMVPHYKSVSFASSNNRIQIRAKSYTNGPTGIQVFFADGVDCTGISWSCRQYFPNVLPADGNWYDVELVMTDANWTDGDSITMLRFDLVDQTSLGTAQFDWVKVSDGVTPTTIADFNVDGPFALISLGAVAAGDVLEFYADNAKNASSSAYRISVDKVAIDANSYEENDPAFTCDAHSTSPHWTGITYDCKNGYSLGWKRWKSGMMLLYELMIRNLYNDSIYTTTQIKSHIEKLSTANQGAGVYGISQDENDACIKTTNSYPDISQGGYFYKEGDYPMVACNRGYMNGGSDLANNLAILQLAKKYINDDPLWYRLDEKTDRIKTTGTWTNEKTTDMRWSLNNIRSIADLDKGMMYLPTQNTSSVYIYKDVTDFAASYNRITLRIRSFKNGPTGITVYFMASGCSWHSCSQTFNSVMTADGSWQTVNLDMTHANWTGTITSLDIQFDGATAWDTLLVDYIRRSQGGVNEVSIDEFYSPYYRNYVWKSSSAASTLELTGVPFTDLEVYMANGIDQGSVKIYYDNGSGYDAGTTVDLTTASNPVYTKAGLAYSSAYKIKIEVLSGTARLDYMRVKTKPSYLMTERLKEEYYLHNFVKTSLTTDHTLTSGEYAYRKDTGKNLAPSSHLIFLGEALFALGGFESINPGFNAGPNAGIQGRSNYEEIYQLLMQ